ncbi:hypothetical protein N7451_010659 [Penicillium sp. IBT 35674x]|nr:hypothetical protein N7451_010659 [Penicillium sp. IBT 35674x]
MTLPDTENHCIDPIVNSIDREALKMEIQETIKTKIKEEVQKGFNEIPLFTFTTSHSAEMLLPSPKVGHFDSVADSIERGVLKCEDEETIKKEFEDDSQVDYKEETHIFTHTIPHSPPNSKVNYFDISSDNADHACIEEDIKEEVKENFREELKEGSKEATRKAIDETKEQASRKATKRKIDEILDGEGSAEVNFITPVSSNTVDLPVDQTWNSLEEAYEAILDFVHRQGYGAIYYQRSCRTSLPEYVHLACDVLEMKKPDRVNKDGERKVIRAKDTNTCSFGAIIMNCLNSWRIVKISNARHSHEPLSPRALPSQHRLERKRKEAWILQMMKQGFSNERIVQKIQLQDPDSSLDRQDIKNMRLIPKKMQKSELRIQLQMDATDNKVPSLSPQTPANQRRIERNTNRAYIIQQVQQGLSNETIVQQLRRQDPNSCLDRQDINQIRGNQKRNWKSALYRRQLTGTTDDDLLNHGPLSLEATATRRQLERDMKRAYIIQQIQQGLSNLTIVQQIRRQDPNSYLDRIDIANMRATQKKRQISALQRQFLKGSTDGELTEAHRLSIKESDDGLAGDDRLLIEEMSDEKDCKLPKKEIG